MSDLAQSTRRLISSTLGIEGPETPEAVREFIETITFSNSDDIVSMLHSFLADDWMALPVWARNLAYRLACLQRPNDPDLLREAAADLLSFGPDWDDEANALRTRAALLDSSDQTGASQGDS